jgi:phosphotransacetylase
MHLDLAVVEDIVRENFPHSRIRGDANVLIFPNLAAGNIGYKLVKQLGRAETIGPILMGMRRPVSVLSHGTTVADIVNLTAITAVVADQVAAPGHDVTAVVADRVAAPHQDERVGAGVGM